MSKTRRKAESVVPQAEAGRRALLQRQEAILATVPDIIAEVDNDKVYTWANQAALDFFGPDMVGREAAAYFVGEQETYDVVEPVFVGEDRVVYVESWQRRRDGEIRLLAWRCRTLKDETGAVVGALSAAEDITEHHRAELALRDSRRLLAESQAITRVGGWEYDVASRHIAWTEEVYRIHGVGHDYDPNDVTRSIGFYAPAYAPVIARAFERAVDHGEPYDLELEFVRASGEHIWVRTVGRPIVEAGTVVRVTGNIMDITDRKKTELALRRSQLELRALYECAPSMMCVLDASRQVLYANRAFVEFVGRPLEELRQERACGVIGCPRALDDPRGCGYGPHCQDCTVRLAMADALVSGRNHCGIEYRTTALCHGQPRESVFLASIAPIQVGSETHLLLCLDDISERVRAEEALRDNLRFVQATIDSLSAHVCVLDETGTILAVNRAWTDFAVANPPVAGNVGVGANYLAVCDGVTGADAESAQAFAGGIRAVLAGTQAAFGREYACHSPAEQRWFMGRITPFAGAGPRRVVIAHENITERRRAEEALREKHAELERFTYLVSHNLRSPLVTIRAFLGHLGKDLAGNDVTAIRQDWDYLNTAADKMAQLLDELLSLSRVGRLKNPPEDVSLQALVQEALALVAGRLTARLVNATVSAEPLSLHGDRPRLVELFQNLLDNACKFMGEQPTPCLDVSWEQQGAETVICVRDNGIGMEPKYQARVFGLFDQLDSKVPGTGIGLALAKRIVEMHGGRIWVESAGAGRGCAFRFTLPRATGRTQEAPGLPP